MSSPAEYLRTWRRRSLCDGIARIRSTAPPSAGSHSSTSAGSEADGGSCGAARPVAAANSWITAPGAGPTATTPSTAARTGGATWPGCTVMSSMLSAASVMAVGAPGGDSGMR